MTRVNPDELAWVESGPGVRYKSVTQSGRRARVVEISEGFHEPDWCRRGHSGYVLEGRLAVTFAERVEEWSPGDMVLIKAGEEDKHRARVLQGPVRLFLVEDE